MVSCAAVGSIYPQAQEINSRAKLRRPDASGGAVQHREGLMATTRASRADSVSGAAGHSQKNCGHCEKRVGSSTRGALARLERASAEGAAKRKTAATVATSAAKTGRNARPERNAAHGKQAKPWIESPVCRCPCVSSAKFPEPALVLGVLVFRTEYRRPCHQSPRPWAARLASPGRGPGAYWLASWLLEVPVRGGVPHSRPLRPEPSFAASTASMRCLQTAHAFTDSVTMVADHRCWARPGCAAFGHAAAAP